MSINAIMPKTPSLDTAPKELEVASEKVQEANQQKVDGTGGSEESQRMDPKRFDTFEKGKDGSESDETGIYDKPQEDNGDDKKVEDSKCTVNTDKVDAELRKLQEKAQDIEKQMQSEENADRRAELEQQLQSIESEIDAKDNDSYRKQNASYTFE